MHLFLDTNVYLRFYKLSGDDIEELKKLAVVARTPETTLHLPGQVRDEFARGRASVIRASLNDVERSQIPKAYPALFRNLPGFDGLKAAEAVFERQRQKLLNDAKVAALDFGTRGRRTHHRAVRERGGRRYNRNGMGGSSQAPSQGQPARQA